MLTSGVDALTKPVKRPELVSTARLGTGVLLPVGEPPDAEDDDDGDNKDDSEDKALYRKASLFAGIGSPPERPLPDPLPERAFAHIRPEDWLPSISTPMKSEDDEGSVVEVTAKIVDEPLEVLPGRDKEFRSFVGKVSFLLSFSSVPHSHSIPNLVYV